MALPSPNFPTYVRPVCVSESGIKQRNKRDGRTPRRRKSSNTPTVTELRTKAQRESIFRRRSVAPRSARERHDYLFPGPL